MAEVKSHKVKQLSSRLDPNAIYWVQASANLPIEGFITDINGVPYPLKDLQGTNGITGLTNTDGNLVITGADNKVINLAPALLSVINSALQSGDNISELVNDAGYITSFTETDPIFQASEASNFVAGDKANLDNQSGINSGDETTLSIQTKRPLKTVNGESLEGTGNIGIDYNDLDNKPPTFPPSSHTHVEADITDLDKYTQSETNNLLGNKLDKDTTAGVERAYIINADGSQGTKATSDFKDVLEFANFSSFPTTGETGIIYVALDKNFTYRWSGSAYVQVGGTAKKTENLFFQDAIGSTVRTITADQKNMHQSRFLANASPYGQLGLTLGNGVTEVGGVVNLSNFSDVITPQITGDYIGKVKKIVFSYSRNVAESTANTNLMIRVMAETKCNTDMQLIAEHNLVSTTTIGNNERKVEIPVLTHLPLSAFSNIGWCIRSNNATAQQFSRIKINVIVEEI